MSPERDLPEPATPRDSTSVGLREEHFARAIALIDAELDWELLAEEHGASSAEEFFGEEQRDAMFDTGLRFASDLAERLEPRGRSLYLGAAVAEIVPMLFESLVMDRQVCWLNLDGPEFVEYRRAFGKVQADLSLALPAPVGRPLGELALNGRFDHLWFVSVLTDPTSFPGLHDHLYQRGGTRESADPDGRADLGLERSRALALAGEALGRMQAESGGGSWIASTDEEWPLLLEAARAHSRVCELEGRARLSGLVGDAVRFGRLL